MKFGSLIRFATDFIYKKKINLFFVSMMCIISVILINLIIVEYYSINYEKREIERVVKYKSKDIGYIKYSYDELKKMDKKKENKILLELKKIKGIKQCGTFDNVSVLFDELYKNDEYLKMRKEIVNSMVEEIHSEFNEVERLMMSQTLYKYSNVLKIEPNMLNLCDLDIYKGKIIKKKNGYIPLLIGYKYHDFIKIGQILTSTTDKKKYIVTGILKKNSSWLTNGDISNASNTSINLDNLFVAIDDEMLNYDSSYIIFDESDNENTRSNVLKMIEKVSEKYKINFKILTIEEILCNMKSDMFLISKSWIALAIFSLIIGILSMSSVAIVTVLSRKSDIGILYALGFSEKIIGMIIIIENILQIGFGCIMGFCIAFFLSIYNNTTSVVERVIDIQFKQGIISIIGIFILCTLIASITPLIILNKSKPSELIEK